MKKIKEYTLVLISLIFIKTAALAQGPVAPEATSFEPVDATDMVNLVTGDLSYVLPLVSIPGPEGGYPLSLSYHAGIAMEQEASWVGLGWSLNPGAINRSVNGYPDDWKKTNISEFYYDQGESTDYYSFDIGGTLPNGLTIGLSKSWGGYKAWGGKVGFGAYSVNYGSNGFGGSFLIPGTNIGVSMLPGEKGLNTSVSYGIGQEGIYSIGGSLNFNSSSKKITVSGRASLKVNGIGMSLNSNGGFGASFNGFSASSSSSSSTSGDYFIKQTNRSYGFDTGFFWVGYRHTNVSYSLFNDNIIAGSGIINTFDYKNNVNVPYTSDDKKTMDVREYYADDKNIGNYTEHSPYFLATIPTIVLPNYDNYSVSAQGIGGTITPKIFSEIKLAAKDYYRTGEYTSIPDADYIERVNHIYENSTNQSDYSLNNKIHFYFKNTNSSFLRVNSGNYDGPGLITDFNTVPNQNNISIYNTFESHNYNTSVDNTYSGNITIDGELKKNGNRKRDGNFIETFTVNDIINGNTNGWFLETKSVGFSRHNQFRQSHSYKDGIGAYRITTNDGKVYHYSQPVYHYESLRKSFKSSDNEDEKFFESKKIEPYATHWLLTAITGPDYIDNNNNGQLDEEDYGYWVEFEYGKWSDGFGWKSPREGFKIFSGTNSYFSGVKEVYYLDQIKTRTHSALFIKSIRNDNKSFIIENYTNKWNGTSSIDIGDEFCKYYVDPQSKYYTLYGDYYEDNFTTTGNTHEFNNYNGHSLYDYKKFNKQYIDMPENLSLKLDKILILKNEDAVYNKTVDGSLSSYRKIGYTYHNFGYFKSYYDQYYNYTLTQFSAMQQQLPNEHHINSDQNVLDNYDIQGLNLENKSIKQIVFNHDYSLSNNLPNSSQGHLSLKTIDFRGKNNSSLAPPYEFSYLKPNTPYNKDNQDVWGYPFDVDAWSLYKIKSPLGSSIEIEYEEDSFIAEAAYRTNDFFGQRAKFNSLVRENLPESNNILSIEKGNDYIKLFLDQNKIQFNLIDNSYIGENIWLNINGKYFENQTTVNRNLSNNYTVDNINQTLGYIKFIINETTNINTHNDLIDLKCLIVDNVNDLNNYSINGPAENCLYNLNCAITSVPFNDINGKLGGGLRVKSITVLEENSSYKSAYDYKSPVTNKVSGITSYEPFDGDNKVVPYIEEIPSPNVMYSDVCVSNIINNQQQDYIKYHFKTLSPFVINDDESVLYSLGDDFKVIRSQHLGGYNPSNISLSTPQPFQERIYKHTIHNNLSNIGQLQSIKNYNLADQLISSKYYNYKNFNENIENHDYGINQESFKTVKTAEFKVTNNNGTIGKKIINIGSTSIVEYPSKLISSETVSKSYSLKQENHYFDFLTGQVLETITEDSKGNIFKTEVTPAYHISNYNLSSYGMGAKVDNISNKNMLAQQAMTKTYIDDNGTWQETGVGITTWNNNWTYSNTNETLETPTNNDEKIWRKHKTYVWDGELTEDGLYEDFVGDDDNFNWSIGAAQTNTKWKNVATTSKYDHFSMPLEVKDINNNFAVTKMCDDNTKVSLSASSKYYESFYTGAEYYDTSTSRLDAQVRGASNLRTTEKAHTGKYSLKITPSDNSFGAELKGDPSGNQEHHRAGRYKMSVWVHKDNHQNARYRTLGGGIYDFNGEKVFAGDWVQLNHYFDRTVAQTNTTTVYMVISNSGTIYIDDFRLHPIQSSMTSYVYNEWDELECILGANNLATKFEYDSQGRLVKTYTEAVDSGTNVGGFKKTSENFYNYKNQ